MKLKSCSRWTLWPVFINGSVFIRIVGEHVPRGETVPGIEGTGVMITFSCPDFQGKSALEKITLHQVLYCPVFTFPFQLQSILDVFLTGKWRLCCSASHQDVVQKSWPYCACRCIHTHHLPWCWHDSREESSQGNGSCTCWTLLRVSPLLQKPLSLKFFDNAVNGSIMCNIF